MNRLGWHHLLWWLGIGLISTSTLAANLSSHFFTARDGLRLHYLEAGSGAQTIVFIPGWLMPATVFRLQLKVLGDEFRVLAFDPRSQGQSEISRGAHDPARRMADMEDFLQAAGVGDYVLAGWSLGVLEALDFIERKPQSGLRGLILIDNSIGEGTPPVARARKPQGDRSAPKSREHYLTNFCRSIFANPPPADIADAVLRSALQVPESAARELLGQPYPRTYWRDIVARQEVPVLYAIRPRLREQGEALQSRKGALAQVEIFEQAGHTLFVDEPERFNAMTAVFARRAFMSWPDGERSALSARPLSSGN